jgi:hypothetical protein
MPPTPPHACSCPHYPAFCHCHCSLNFGHQSAFPGKSLRISPYYPLMSFPACAYPCLAHPTNIGGGMIMYVLSSWFSFSSPLGMDCVCPYLHVPRTVMYSTAPFTILFRLAPRPNFELLSPFRPASFYTSCRPSDRLSSHRTAAPTRKFHTLSSPSRAAVQSCDAACRAHAASAIANTFSRAEDGA